jgi:hypothetical protein
VTFSPLISGTVPHHDKYSSRQGSPIVRVLQHHHAATSDAGLARLTNPDQQASTTYVIMSDGSILGQVPEEFRPWTSGSFEADAGSITIEVQNSSGQVNGNDSDPNSWKVSAAAYNSIIALLADVARRYGWGGVTASNYRGHREFSSTACPGGYLWSLMDNTRAAAQATFDGGTITTQGTITPKEWYEMALDAQVKTDIFDAVWGSPGTPLIFNNELQREEYPRTTLGAMTDRIIRQHIAPMRQELAAQSAVTQNLVKALANVTGGEALDQDKLLAGIKATVIEATKLGFQASIESVTTTSTTTTAVK